MGGLPLSGFLKMLSSRHLTRELKVRLIPDNVYFQTFRPPQSFFEKNFGSASMNNTNRMIMKKLLVLTAICLFVVISCINTDQKSKSAYNNQEAEKLLEQAQIDRKSTRLNSSHVKISYAVFCLKKKKKQKQ